MLVQSKALEIPCPEWLGAVFRYLHSAWKRYPFRFALCISILIHVFSIFSLGAWGDSTP